jgi:hypothetical protein
MRHLKDVNWSAFLRDAIEHRIKLEETIAERDWQKIHEADKLTEEIFNEMHKRHGHVEYDSTETIRSWREKRHGNTR